MKDKFGRHHLCAAGRPAAPPRLFADKGKPDQASRAALTWVIEKASTQATAPSPGCGWPGCWRTPSPTTKRSSNSKASCRPNSSRWRPTAAATSTTCKASGRGQGAIPQGLERAGRTGRIPHAGGVQAQRAGRRSQAGRHRAGRSRFGGSQAMMALARQGAALVLAAGLAGCSMMPSWLDQQQLRQAAAGRPGPEHRADHRAAGLDRADRQGRPAAVADRQWLQRGARQRRGRRDADWMRPPVACCGRAMPAARWQPASAPMASWCR